MTGIDLAEGSACVPMALDLFRQRFGRWPEGIALAPGRINLIGEHTDYNEGFVFPAAIDRFVAVAFAASNGTTRLVSTELAEGASFDARSVEPGTVSGWAAYAAGTAWAIRDAGHGTPPNVDAAVSSDVPIGSGISSSAALELSFGAMWNALVSTAIPGPELALICQRAENDFVGVRCGIMDQMASAMGRRGSAMFLDTRSLDIEYARIPEDWVLVVCDTLAPRSLADSAYNERRAQCEVAAAALGISSLRDATLEAISSSNLDAVLMRRARHVVTENQRCVHFKRALDDADEMTVGALMDESHRSLRDDYEVSGRELDAMASAARSSPGCVGARMTGAGFGGACVALVLATNLGDFLQETARLYRRSTGVEPHLLPCRTADGARVQRNLPA